MTRQDLEKYITEEYAVTPECLWEGDNITAAIRHNNTKKWFGIFMNIPARKLGFNSDDFVDVVNVKLDPDFIQELLVNKVGEVFPAYHMNKKHWLTILLNKNTDAELVKALLNDSYGLTL